MIDQTHVNNHKTIHGGAILSLTDTVTSLALSTLGITPPTGMSVNISTEFVRPGGKVGDEIIAVGEVTKMGESFAPQRAESLCQERRWTKGGQADIRPDVGIYPSQLLHARREAGGFWITYEVHGFC